MASVFIFGLFLSSFILPAASHRGEHSHGAHEMPHLHQKYIADDFIDVVTDSEFFGLNTFANLPYVNCLKAEETEEAKYDIAILGAPFDTVCQACFEIACLELTSFDRASQVDLVLDLAQLGYAEAHREWLQVMLGISIQVNNSHESLETPV